MDKPEFTIITVGPNSWGKAQTVSESVHNCKMNIPWHYVKGKSATVAVYYCHPQTKVTDMGGLQHPIEFKPVLIDTVKVRQR